MNTDRTERILRPEERAKYNMPPVPGPAAAPRKQEKSSSTGKYVGLGALGIVAGVAGAAGISAYAMPRPPQETDHIFPEDPDDGSDAHSGHSHSHGHEGVGGGSHGGVALDVPSLDEIQFAESPDDSMSFNQAFAAARAEVGPHGVFEWRGGYYGTYYANEWSSLPSSYRQQFANHDWSELGIGEPYHPSDHLAESDAPKLITHEDGRVEIVLTNATTGEEIHYFPDGEVVPVIDDHGQVIAMVNKSALEEAERMGGVLAVLSSGDPVVVDEPSNLATLFEDPVDEIGFVDFDPAEGVETGEVVEGSDGSDDIAAVIEDDDDIDEEVIAIVDDDPAVVDVNDDIHIAEIIDDDISIVPDVETMDFDPGFNDDDLDDMAYTGGDDINYEDHSMIDDGFSDMMDDDMMLG